MSQQGEHNEPGPDDPIDLEPPADGAPPPVPDHRPRVPEPPPVRLVAIDDVRLPAEAGIERELDAFYVDVLGFEREGAARQSHRRIEPMPGIVPEPGRAVSLPPIALGLRNAEEPRLSLMPAAPDVPTGPLDAGPIYRAENFRLHLGLVQGPIVRDSLRPAGIEVPSLIETEAKLIEAEIPYVRQRGVTPGHESLLLLDPAGNPIEVVEARVMS